MRAGGGDPFDATVRRQARAADPRHSAWVSANAGAGKTHVLALRVVRLLLSGVEPSRILCLTYTTVGAAQMIERVHRRLGEWATLPEDRLRAVLAEVMEHRDAPVPFALVERARRLFAHALDTPGGLKIQTIHAFCESVLHRFPLEANVSARFRKVDDAEKALHLGAIRERMLGELREGAPAGAGAEPLAADADALRGVVRHGQEDALGKLLGAIANARPALERLLAHHGDAARAEARLRAGMGLAPDDTPDTLAAGAWTAPTLCEDRLRAARDCSRSHEGKTNLDLADRIDAMFGADPFDRFALLGDLVLTQKGEQRVKAGPDGGLKLSSSFTVKVQGDLPWLLEAMLEAAIHVSEVRDRIQACHAAAMGGRALRIAGRMLRDWRQLKHRHGLLDFDDLIARTADLLERDGGASWVHYKLDQGIDHILVDEAQDTSPDQWRVIESLTSEFFAGDGAPGRTQTRTVFAVGDPKQSIYSFQGAAPKGFAERRAAYDRAARAARQRLEVVPLNLSFRSTRDVLGAVDTVFAAEANRQGLIDGGEAVGHEARRHRDRGRVELWPVEAPPEEEPAPKERWDEPIDHVGSDDPRSRLARRIATRVRWWLDGADPLHPRRADGPDGAPRPVGAGDILVLVRKRDAFVGTLARALKDRGVPVAGEDRLALTEHIAVEDLIAAGRFTLNPHDDLTVASLFKSPLLGLNEDDLFALAHGRPADQSLYRTLRARRDQDPRWREAAERLHQWRMRVDTEPPYEFYSRILGADGGRRRMLERLGAQSNDVMDEFLSRALEDRDAGLPGLEAFLAALTEEAPTIKREMDGAASEVRIMTVHAAKGMEAPIVFLACCGAEPVSTAHLPILVPLPGGPDESAPPPIAWAAPGIKAPTAIESARAAAKARQADEYRRLLYVGMTRAEDRLIVCGYRGARAYDDTWHAMCAGALVDGGRCDPVGGEDDAERTHLFRVEGRDEPGALAREWKALQAPSAKGADDPPPNAAPGQGAARVRPHWLSPARAERDLPRPLAPSGATALIGGEEGGMGGRAAPILGIGGLLGTAEPDDAGRRHAARAAMRRGTVVHRLLQVLPDLDPAEREGAAKRYLDRACADLDGRWRNDVAQTALRTLRDPALASLFEPGARTEVAIMGTLEIGGAPQAVSGVIDRMVVKGDRVLLVDFKTGHPPRSGADVPPAHVAQMALYRALAAPLYPAREIACALVYTRAPERHDLAAAAMDDALDRIVSGEGIGRDAT